MKEHRKDVTVPHLEYKILLCIPVCDYLRYANDEHFTMVA